MFLMNDGSGWHHRLEFTTYCGFDWPGHGQTKGSHVDCWPHLSPSFASLITSSGTEVKAFSLTANSEKRVSCFFFFFKWWNLSQLATGSYFAMGRGGARCCGSVPVDLGQAGIVIIPTPEQSPFSSSSRIMWQMFESLPRVSQMASPLQRPFSYSQRKRKEKKRGDDRADALIIAQGWTPGGLAITEFVETWPFPPWLEHVKD